MFSCGSGGVGLAGERVKARRLACLGLRAGHNTQLPAAPGCEC